MRRLTISLALLAAAVGTKAHAQETIPDDPRAELFASSELDAERAAWMAERDRRVAALRPTGGLDGHCVDVGLLDCQATAGGFLRRGDVRLAWQVQEGFTELDGVAGGLVVLAPGAGDAWKPILWSTEAYRFAAPRLIEDGETLLLMASGLGRTWMPGADLALAVYEGGRWRRIDTDWTSRAGDLMAGRDLRNGGLDWSLDELTAGADLYRPEDANCCPSGGRAYLTFRVDGDRLMLEDLNVLGQDD